MSKVFSPKVIAVVAAVIGLVAGFGLGYAYFQPRLADVQIEKSRLEVLLSTTNASLSKTLHELADKEAELKSAKEHITALDKEMALMNATLRGRIALMNETVATLEGKIAKIEKALFKLDNDRRLLIYLRMELPETRQEALEYWEYVKNMSIQSDARLGPLVDKIIFYIDPYFDWLERLPSPGAPEEEWAAWLLEEYLTAAIEYPLAIDKFTREVYLVIVTHIEVAVELAS